ncbi:MAG: 3'(2'),5'-bisphosphate nucleotidase CysQ [Acidiferrobacterales bacterium]|nr:3'(2'),5'-bisphosphate nucleotidase CysQ [Acidiferrobacterales bacterium]
MKYELETLLPSVVKIAEQAGEAILKVYESSDFDVEMKGDGSPLTRADREANGVIEAALGELPPGIPILSEESGEGAFASRHSWRTFWLVDPLDGTKEFVKRNGEFTVNIALIDQGKPVLGVVHTPVMNTTHFGTLPGGAFKKSETGTEQITVRTISEKRVTMVASRSHAGPEVQAYQRNLGGRFAQIDIESMGSSLKMCLVAEGLADIYPRLGPTSEWDTGAAHCVLKAAGGCMLRLDGEPLAYNKPDILNPWFLACGDPEVDWVSFSDGIQEG